MNMPGFTAEAAFIKSTKRYLKVHLSNSTNGEGDSVYPSRRLRIKLTYGLEGGSGGGSGGGSVIVDGGIVRPDFESDERYPHYHGGDDGSSGGGSAGAGNGLDLDCFDSCMESCAPDKDPRQNFHGQSQRTKFCGRMCAYKCGHSVLV